MTLQERLKALNIESNLSDGYELSQLVTRIEKAVSLLEQAEVEMKYSDNGYPLIYQALITLKMSQAK